MDCLKNITPLELLAISIIIGLILISVLDFDQMNVIGNTLIGIGGLLIIVATQGIFLKGLAEKKSQEEILRKQLALLH